MVRSRIATAAVVASMIAGLAGCGSSKSTSGGATGGAPTATGTTMTAAPTSSASAPASAPSSGSSESDAAGGFSNAQIQLMQAKVAAVFGQGVTPGWAHSAPSDINTKELAADFESPAVMGEVWGTGAAGTDRPMDCGMAKYDGIAIGAITSTGDAANVPVVLYQGATAGTEAITVNVNPATGVIKGVACGGTAPAPLPGIAPIATYYGAMASQDKSVLNDKSKSFFTPAFTAWHPVSVNYEIDTCSQYSPGSWTVALTASTSASSTWDYSPEPVATIADPDTPSSPTGLPYGMAVDLASAKISRVSCYPASPPAPDRAHPDWYATSLLEHYRQATEQEQLGVDATSFIRPAFVSDAAFTTAWASTGAVPLLCAAKLPGSVALADGTKPVTTGSQITLSMVTWPDWHGDDAGQETSKFTLVLDANTLKISSITCKK